MDGVAAAALLAAAERDFRAAQAAFDGSEAARARYAAALRHLQEVERAVLLSAEGGRPARC